MSEILIDSNVILDLAQWSEDTLERYSRTHILCINAIIYSEISIGFEYIEELEQVLAECAFKMLSIPKPALFLA